MACSPFAAEWARFCADAHDARDHFGVRVVGVYQPGENGRATVTFAAGNDVPQIWKVLARLRRIGWAVKLVPGKTLSLTVDLTVPVSEPATGAADV
jgi:hypothetical protein